MISVIIAILSPPISSVQCVPRGCSLLGQEIVCLVRFVQFKCAVDRLHQTACDVGLSFNSTMGYVADSIFSMAAIFTQSSGS